MWPRFAQISFPSKTTIASVGSTADIVQERQPILERFLRSIYQIIVTEPLLHPLTREIYLILYNFLDIMDYMSGIESLVSLQSLAHGAHMNRLLFLTQDITVEPSQLLKTHDSDQSDPLLYTRRFIEIYIHSVLQLSTFSTRIIDKFINNFQHQCSEYLSQNNRHDHTSSSMSKDFKDKKLGNLSEFINDIQEVLIVGMKDDILELIEFLIHGNIQGRYSYHHPPPTPPSVTPPSSTLTYSESTINNNQPDEIILESIDGIRLRNDIIESLSRIAIRRQIEKEVYIPCSFYLHNVIKQSFQPEEKEFILKCSRLYSQPQTFYGIPPRNLSPSSWEDVVNSLSRLRNQYIPFDKLQILVSSAKLIPITYSKEHQVSTTTSGSDEIDSNNSNTSTSSKSLGADDLLPIFIYCLVRSRLSSILLIISQELDTLCDTDDRVSEIGYYLATLQAAVYHIMVIDERVGDKIS